MYFFKPFYFLLITFFKNLKSHNYEDKELKQKKQSRSEPTIKRTKSTFLKDKNISNNNELHYILPSIDLLKTSNEKLNISKDIEKRNFEFSF